MEWKNWHIERPKGPGPFRWRVAPRNILGIVMAPEWTDKQYLLGVGSFIEEWWPDGSNWDGYNRTIDKTLEFRECTDKEHSEYISISNNIIWHGLDLLPSPFTGLLPYVEPVHLGRPIYYPKELILQSYFFRGTFDSAIALRDAWNLRA